MTKEKKPTVEECMKVIENMAAKITEMEDNSQLIRPVAMALRKELGVVPENSKEEFSLKVLMATKAEPIEAGKKATKRNLADALKLANIVIKNLKTEIEDVRRGARHYLGYQGDDVYSAGSLFVLAATFRIQDIKNAREKVGKFFGLNETATDNLSNDPATIVANVLNKYKEFWKCINEVKTIFEYIAYNIDEDKLGGRDAAMLDIAMKTFERKLDCHFAPGINPVD